MQRDDERVNNAEDGGSSDEEGIDVMNSEGDSSEEEDEDPEEEARIREGFIADDDDEDARERKRRRSKKKRKQREREYEALSEDDLDLVEQNTGVRIERPEGRKLKKLKRAGAASEDEDEQDEQRVPDIANLFDDISARATGKGKGKKRAADGGDGAERGADDMDEDDMADFIEEDSPDEGGDKDKEARLARKAKERERRKKRATGLAMGGLDIGTEAWDEIQEIFGDGHDYDDALESEDEESKPAPRMQDVFEPSEIAERMMTDADDIIRAVDIPERMQIAQAGFRARTPPSAADPAEGAAQPDLEASDTFLFPEELPEAANWVSTRISDDITKEYILTADGQIPPLRDQFVLAVQRVLHFLCIEYFEVPFIWSHRKDYLVYTDPTAFNREDNKVLLKQEDLWKIYSMAIRYRAMLDRKATLMKLWSKLDVQDEYFDEHYNTIANLDEAADLVDYVTLKYHRKLKDMAHQAGAELLADDITADAVRNGPGGVKYKRATGTSRYEQAKDSMVAKFAEQIAISAEALAQGFTAGHKVVDVEDPHSGPMLFAEEYADPSSAYPDYQAVIAAAKVILVNEIAKEPSLRRAMRQTFRGFGAITVKPTDKGAQVIDDMHPFYTFKYLLDKPVEDFHGNAQFLQILQAEGEGLVSVDIHVVKDHLRKLTQDFYTAYLSEESSEVTRAWNKIREDVIVEALQDHLLPLGARYTKDWLKETQEEWIATRCAAKLEDRIDVAPFRAPGKEKGETPRVLAVSAGNSDPRTDHVCTIMLDAKGRFRERRRYKDLTLVDTKIEFREQVERFKPDVIVVGGFRPATHKLKAEIEITTRAIFAEALAKRSGGATIAWGEDAPVEPAEAEETQRVYEIPVIYAYDEVARLFQNSKKGEAEFAELSPTERYCLALARYVQDPLCEYAALGDDLTALTFDPNQRLVPEGKLLPYLQSALVNVTNAAGVEINRAIRDSYYRVLLPYVAGLGPRKASGIVRRISAISEGTLACRADLVKKDICTSRIFMNSVAFLRIPMSDNTEDDDDYDVLDSTRIHNEDYHIARKMAADAEEMDEEDIEDLAHPSGAVAQLIENGAGKLDELSLDDFAAALLETQQLQKRLTLYLIRNELQIPFRERRQTFEQPKDSEIFTMISGETPKTLDTGLVIPVKVAKVLKHGTICRLNSGLEAWFDKGEQDPLANHSRDQTILAQIRRMRVSHWLHPEDETFQDPSIEGQPNAPPLPVYLTTPPQDLEQINAFVRKVEPDHYFDKTQASMDEQAEQARNKRSQGRQRRVVNHPNFYNFNAGQAEQHLANMQRGDCVVRPSSKGNDHLAVTWKVDDGIYQHIDVLELDKQNEFSLGRSLRIGGKYTYSDLDELIVSHVRSMARKVDEMMHSDKYKGTEGDLRKWLNTSIMAEPTRSFYGFALDLRKPGNFILSFLTKGYDIQSWGISIEPDQFFLQGNNDPAPNVTMLCNAFKSSYITKVALAGGQAAALASRTPYQQQQQQQGRTPNPYGSGMTPYSSRSPYVNRGQAQPPPPPAANTGFIHPSRLAQAGYGR